jgi:hypothetical protein
VSGLFSTACNKDAIKPDGSENLKEVLFETIEDFSGFCITSKGILGATFQELSDSMSITELIL